MERYILLLRKNDFPNFFESLTSTIQWCTNYGIQHSNTERLKYCTIRHSLSNKQTKVMFYSSNNVLYPLLLLFSCKLSYVVFKSLQLRVEFLFFFKSLGSYLTCCFLMVGHIQQLIIVEVL